MNTTVFNPHSVLVRFLRTLPALLLLIHACTASAAVRTWTGGHATSGNWTTAANWSGGVAPVAGDILNFVDTGANKSTTTNNYAAGTTFSTINVFGNGYRLRGNRVTITNSISQGSPTGDNFIDLDFTFGGPDTSITFRTFNSTDSLTFNGDINLNGRRLDPEGPGDITITGVISGSGGIFKNNAGDLSLSGLGANTFTGSTSVGEGVLRLNRYTLSGLNQVGTVAIPGDLVIGDFASTVIGELVILGNNNQIANTSTVSVFPTGALILGTESDTVGELRLRGGTVSTTTGSLGVEGGIYASQPSVVDKDSLIAGRLTLGSRGDGPQIVDVAFGVKLTISAQISGVVGADLIKTNRGELFLTESNIFNGDVEITQGTVIMTDGDALGTTNGITRLMGGMLHLNPLFSFGVPESLVAAGSTPLYEQLRLIDGNVSWLGNIRLEDHLYFTIETNATLSVVGQISGPDGWSKFGPGTLQFKTPYTNNYEGYSAVYDGNFIMDGVFHQPVISGNWFLIFGDPGTTRAWMIKNNQIADTTRVQIYPGGVLDLAGFNDTVGQLTVRGGGTIETGPGLLTLNHDLYAIRGFSETEPARIHGRLSLGGTNRNFLVYTEGDPNNLSLLITAVISDGGAAAGFNKLADGPLQLTGANTFSGPVNVNDGILRVAHPNALGSSAAGTTISGTNGAKIVLDGGVGMTIAAEPLTLNSTGPGSPVALENFTGNNQWNGPITLLAPENTINVVSIPRPLALGGAISGPGGLKKVGPGKLTLNGLPANTFNGHTLVAEGELILDKPTSESINGDITIGDGLGLPNTRRVIIRGLGDEIWNGSRVVINSSGQLILDAVLELVGSLEGSGNILMTNTPTGSGGLIVGRNDLSTTFSGVMSGDGSFSKTGLGTLRLTEAHTLTGPIGVYEGRLEVEGSIAASSHLFVTRNPPEHVFFGRFGTLGGNGSVPRVYNWAGEVSPGVDLPTGTARLQVQGHYESTNGAFRVQLNGTTPGTDYDQLRVSGNVDLGTIHPSILQIATGFSPSTNDVFVIIDKLSPGPVIGQFNNLPDGAVIGTGFNKYQIRYTGGDGNDVTLRRIEVSSSNISGIAAVTPEKMQITGQGVPYATYILESTKTLTSPIPWTPIATNSADASGLYQFMEPYAEAGLNLYPALFFRVQSP